MACSVLSQLHILSAPQFGQDNQEGYPGKGKTDKNELLRLKFKGCCHGTFFLKYLEHLGYNLI